MVTYVAIDVKGDSMSSVISTHEIDGLLTKEDIDNKDTVVFQCRNCKKWTIHNNHRHLEEKYIPCTNCGKIDYDPTSLKSLRSYNPTTDNKRKPQVKK